MAWIVISLLLVLPVAEIVVFLLVADWIGLWNAFFLIILTSGIGVILLRTQGIVIAQHAREFLRQPRLPMSEVFDNACLTLAAIFMALPGFLMTVASVVLYLPPVRSILRWWPAHHLGSTNPAEDPPILEGEWHEVPVNGRTSGSFIDHS